MSTHTPVSEFADIKDISLFQFLLTGQNADKLSPTQLVITVPEHRISCQLPLQIQEAVAELARVREVNAELAAALRNIEHVLAQSVNPDANPFPLAEARAALAKHKAQGST